MKDVARELIIAKIIRRTKLNEDGSARVDNKGVAKELLKIAKLLSAKRYNVIDKIGDWELAIEVRWGGLVTPIILKGGKEVDQLAPNMRQPAAKREFKKYVQKHGRRAKSFTSKEGKKGDRVRIIKNKKLEKEMPGIIGMTGEFGGYSSRGARVKNLTNKRGRVSYGFTDVPSDSIEFI